MENRVTITQYRWAGKWLWIKIKVPCGECSLTEGVIKDLIGKDFPKKNIKFEVLPWLDNWFSVLLRGGWHAPVVFVNNKLVTQGKVLDRGLLGFYVRKALIKNSTPSTDGSVLFGKEGCPFCKRAKEILTERRIPYTYKDVIEDPLATHEIITWVKPLIPSNQPITLPQIFIKGKYIGGCDELEKKILT